MDRTIEQNAAGDRSENRSPTRRDVVRQVAKLVFVAPVVSTFFAHEAYATNYSCYPQGHVCHTTGDFEPCCGTLTCTGNPGVCQP